MYQPSVIETIAWMIASYAFLFGLAGFTAFLVGRALQNRTRKYYQIQAERIRVESRRGSCRCRTD